MSAPKRGMVAGQPIQTQAQNKEFDAGYDRIFGPNRRPVRGRFVVRDGKVVNVDEDWTDAERRAATPTEELIYGGAKATDGTPINSRKRHREYLKHNGLAMAADYSPAYQEREAARRDREEDRKVRSQVDRDVHKIFGG
jgi:hypothetical protein